MSSPQRADQITTQLSRRSFGRMTAQMATMLAAGAALPFYGEANLAMAQLSKTGPIPRQAVAGGRINNAGMEIKPAATAM